MQRTALRAAADADRLGIGGATMKFMGLTICCVLALTGAPVWAQSNSATHQSTTVSDTARFEIVQSPLLAKLAFRLDRFTGDTWQFVSTQDNSYAWQRIKRIPFLNDTKAPGKVNYQIFMSGIRAQVTILMNTTTGASWYVAEDPKDGVFWSPME
jgi:hypothetical protein